MENLFRFALTRPPVEPGELFLPISLNQDSHFQNELRSVPITAPDSVRNKFKAIAERFITTSSYVDQPQSLKLYAVWIKIAKALDHLEMEADISNTMVMEAIETATGQSIVEIINSTDNTEHQKKLRDSIIAIKLLPGEHHRPLHKLANFLRDMHVLERVMQDSLFPDSLQELKLFRRRPLELPAFLQAKSLRSSTPSRPSPVPTEDLKNKLILFMTQFQQYTQAIDELTTINTEHFHFIPSKGSTQSLLPKELRPQALFERKLKKENSTTKNRILTQPTILPNLQPTIQPTIQPTNELTINIPKARTNLTSRTAFNPVDAKSTAFVLTEKSLNAFSDTTRKIFLEDGISITKQPLDEIITSLRKKVSALTQNMEEVVGKSVQKSFKRVGQTIVVTSTPFATPWSGVFFGGGLVLDDYLPSPMPPIPVESIPHTHGSIAPAGIMDLLIVKQHLVGYQAMDVAHIENILRGEKKLREHRTRQETERLSVFETEVSKTDERELESTDRFEMSRETSETINEEASLQAGITISGKYGPVVEFTASAEGSVSRSKEQSTNLATSYSKEVTQKSAQKISERVLTRESLRITREVEEKNEHTLDNVDNTEHVIGIYQWIEKIYEAQIFNYGLRTMYDFMIPEPGAFLIEALRRSHLSAIELEKPMAFTLKPHQITEFNYSTWVHEYRTSDVVPPPEPYITKTMDYSAGGGDDKTNYYHSGQISIDEGYRAVFASVGVVDNIWDDNAVVDIVIGKRAHRFHDTDPWVWTTPLDSEYNALPVALKTWNVSDVGIAIEVKAQRTDRAMEKWRYETHGKLMQAYQNLLKEYQEKLDALEANVGEPIEGQGPLANQGLIKDELKKACVSLLTKQHFDLFDAIENGTNGLPQIDLIESEAEGPYVRFFEQAFEWEHMTWVTYPYFWGRKSEWSQRIAFQDSDPLFNQFIKAGFCRVSVPVRENFEGAVDHFMTFGEIWQGGPLPTASSPLYLPIANELAERLNRPTGTEVAQGDPWEVRIPTSLVKLKEDGVLPGWHKDADGAWVPN